MGEVLKQEAEEKRGSMWSILWAAIWLIITSVATGVVSWISCGGC